jgi:hypothetical protein
VNKSQARIASAWERRNCGQVGPVRRGEQSPVRPVQLRPARLPPLQDGKLMAQHQDLRCLPRLVTPRQPRPRGGSRDQEKHKPQAHER